MRITAEMVAEAEAEVTEAEQVRGVAEEALMEAPNSTLKAQELAVALKRVAQCRANARELREEQDRQVTAEQAAATREQLEKAAAGEIRAAGRELKGGQQALAEAAERAQAALVEMLAAGGSYNALVARHAAVLGGAGLGLDGETGGGQSMAGGPRVRVKGAAYEVVDPGKAVAWLVHRLAVARLPQGHCLLSLQWVSREVERGSAGLLDGVSEPERVVRAEPLRAVNAYQAQLAARK